MKPNQARKDPRITNISLDNFTGSICIITPESDDDDDDEDLMLSSSQPNTSNDLFKPHHHLALITQPVLGARSRKKDKHDSLNNSRRNSLNESPALILPIHSFQHEKKISTQESSDSGLDFSLSTNSSGQQQQHSHHPIVHRPLSALNEDSSTDDGFHDQPIRHRHFIQENEQRKLMKKFHEDLLTDTQIIPPPVQRRLSNDLTNNSIQKSKKSSRKKPKLNLIIEPTISPSHSHPSDHSLPTSHVIRTGNPLIKPKSITPLGHYPNPEQIRAHINRSVIERQHPSYLPTGTQQQNAVLSKADQLVSKQIKPPLSIFRSNLNPYRTSFPRQVKPILPELHHEDKSNLHKEPIRMRINEPLKVSPKRELRTEQFLTSTPRRHVELQPFKHVRSKIPLNNQRIQPNGLLVQTNKLSNQRKNDLPIESTYPKKFLRLPHMDHPIGSNDQSPRIQRMKIHSRRQQKDIHHSNRQLQNQSPTSWAIICEHQLHHHQPQEPSSSSSPDDFIMGEIYQLTPPDEQELLDGRYVIPDIALFRKFVDCASQTSSRHTHPFTCGNDLNFPNAQHETIVPETHENLVASHTHSSSSSSSLDRPPPPPPPPVNDLPSIPLEKMNISIDRDDLSTNYDSDDGWSNESAELIYADEQYFERKKKNISS